MIEDILNLILVDEDIRPAMLFQSGDNANITKFLQYTKKNFPNLITSDNYNVYQGIIISKKNYNNRIIGPNQMGKILGYLCYDEFETLNRDEILFEIKINVIFDNSNPITIITNVCANQDKLEEYNILAMNIYNTFEQASWTKLIGNIKLLSVNVLVKEILSAKMLLQKILNKCALDEEGIDDLIDDLWNFGFESDTIDEIINNYQYDNEFHRGIITTIFLTCEHNQIGPFIPTSKYSFHEKVDQIQVNLGISILDTIKSNKN